MRVRKGLVLFICILVLLQSYSQTFENCRPTLFASSGTIEDKPIIFIKTICGNKAIPDVPLVVYRNSEKILKVKSDSRGNYQYIAEVPGVYSIVADFSSIGFGKTEREADMRYEPQIVVVRAGNLYEICTDSNSGVIYIEDNNTGKMLRLENKCAFYKTQSEEFKIKIKATETEKEATYIASKLLRVDYPKVVIKGKAIVIKVYENSKPINKALVELGSKRKYTSDKGVAVFRVYKPGAYKIVVKKEGYKTFEGNIEIVNEAPIKVFLPEKVELGSVFKVEVKNVDGSAIKNALIRFQDQEIFTNYYGEAYLDAKKAGTFTLRINYNEFEVNKEIIVYTKSKEKVKERKLNISVPEKIMENAPLAITVSDESGKGVRAFVEINGKLFETDESGKVTIVELEPGTYVIKATKEGYKEAYATVKIEKIQNVVYEPIVPNRILFIMLIISLSTLSYGAYRMFQKWRLRHS